MDTPSSHLLKRLRGLIQSVCGFLALLIFLFPNSVNAQCATPTGVAGQIIFSEEDNVPAYCDGTNWIGTAHVDDPCKNSPLSAGTTCKDGSIYVGLSPDGNLPMYTTTKDAPGGTVYAWNNGNASGYTTTGATSRITGESNTAVMVSLDADSVTAGVQPHQAAQYCADLVSNGHDDWYLPSEDEFEVFEPNFTTIGGFVAGGACADNCYHISVEDTQSSSRLMHNYGPNSTAITGGVVKQTLANVRCVRKEDPQQTQIVPSGLVAYYRMDENSGTAITDYSGNDYGATDNAVVSAQTGAVNTAIDGDTITLDTDDVFDSLTEGTISAWIKWNGSDAAERSVFSLYNIAPNSYFQPLQIENGEIKLWGCGTNFTSSSQPIKPGRWHHVLYHSDATNGHKVYVDGVEVRSSTVHAFFNNCDSVGNVSSYRIGHAGNFELFDGPIDEFRIYNRVLTEDEIQQLADTKDGIRYNKNHRKLEYFDGNQFVSMTPAWPEPATTKSTYDCAETGDVCSDGTVRAGTSPDGNIAMYTTRCNQGQIWDGSTCTGSASYFTWNELFSHTDYTVTGATDPDDGDTNTALIITIDADGTEPGVQQHDAAQACTDLVSNGHSDWYLPAINELEEMYNNRATIGEFENDDYWSSTESATHATYRIDFSDGANGGSTKNGGYNVRCARKSDLTATGAGGLIGHWKLDETSGSTAYDASGNGLHASMGNGQTATGNSIVGPVGPAININYGDNPTILAAHSGEFDITDQITLSAWVLIGPGTSWKRVLGKNSGVGDYLLQISPTSTDLCLTWLGGATNCLSFTFDTERWHHVAATFIDSSDTIELYVDGTSLGTLNTTDSFTPTGNAIGIGSTFPPDAVDDARIYDRALASGEILQLYNLGAPVGTSTALPQGCPNIGNVCDDGTYYIGLSPDGSVPMFAAKEDAPTELPWNDDISGSETNTGATDVNTGAANNNLIITVDSNSSLAGFQEHAAPQYCHDLYHAGAHDWYLPSRNELGNIYNSGQPIANVSTGWQYWSSTEAFSNIARARDMTTGNEPNRGKSADLKVRCVRKGPAPRCANPYGLEGQMIYNTNGNVVQYCDGARWIAIGKDN